MSDRCGDCGVSPGEPHIDGCDVARCTECGWQRISCEHGNSDDGWGATWTGVWPGVAECRDLNLWCVEWRYGQWWFPVPAPEPDAREDLNRLAMMGHSGGVVWDRNQQLWVRPEVMSL